MPQKLTEGSISRSLIRFSLPFLVSNFIQILYGLVDLYIIGRYCNSAVITAVSVGSQVMHLVTVVITSLLMGTTVMISHGIGANDSQKIKKNIGNSTTFFTIFSVALCIIMLLFNNTLLKLLSVPEESLKEAKIYLVICFLGIPFITMCNLLSAILRGLGDSKTPMYFIAIACVVNIILDFLFIGILKLSAMGAALGTVIAQSISVFLGLLIIRRKKLNLNLSKSDFFLEPFTLKKNFSVGIPIAFQDGIVQISFIIITKIANGRGIEMAAAVGIVEKIISIMFLIPSSMLSSISTFCAQNAGANLHKRAKKALALGILITSISGIIISLLTQISPESLIAIFTNESEVQQFGGQYLRSYVTDCIFAGIHFCFSGYFAAYQKSLLCFIHNIASVVLARIPISEIATILYPQNLFPMGMAAPLGSILSDLICIVFFIIFFRKISKTDKIILQNE